MLAPCLLAAGAYWFLKLATDMEILFGLMLIRGCKGHGCYDQRRVIADFEFIVVDQLIDRSCQSWKEHENGH
ncbi:hypothetical protein U1Q18_002145 [Sarracenia purpurea var. burkii]